MYEPSQGATRRAFLKTGAGIAGTIVLSTVMPAPLRGQFGARWDAIPPIEDPRVKELLLIALDAAKRAGADYADVRMTHTIDRSVSLQYISDGEDVHVSVRALVKGYWGFSSSPVLSRDELARLARAATYQAHTNALGKARAIDMAPVPVVADGHWIMPVKTDPLTVHPLAIQDYLGGLQNQVIHEAEVGRGEYVNVEFGAAFMVQERALATTDGTYVTQRVYRTSGDASVQLTRSLDNDRQSGGRTLDELLPAGVGWELFEDQPIRERALQKILELRAEFNLPQQPAEIGRYKGVLDAAGMAMLVSRSIGAASELDRALGYEANAAGTSYLADPLAMVDSFVIGSPLVSITANRSERGGVATVQWDDEGVAPSPFTVVEHGVLRNYHYTREGAGWLRANGVHRPFQSYGVAGAPTAVDPPLPRMANLVLTPSDDAADGDSLVAEMGTGIAIHDANAALDFQLRTGMLYGRMYAVKGGKRVARLKGGGLVFSTMPLWKSLTALGGVGSARRFGISAYKGEPQQEFYHSVTAVPAAFKEFTVVDLDRR